MGRSRRARRNRGRRGSAGSGGAAGRWATRGLLAVVVLAVAGVLGGYFWLQKFLRSERFRDLVNSKVSETLEVDASFREFRWDGMEVRSPEFEAAGANLIRRAELEGLETEVRFAPLLGRKLETREIRARRLAIELDATKEAPVIRPGAKDSFSFAGARIDELTGMVDFGPTALKWDGVQASVTPGPSSGSYEATLSHGRFFTPLPLFPELRLEDASLRFADKALFLKRGTWGVYQSGRLTTYGEFDFADGEYAVSGELRSVQCEEVLPDDWKKRLRGELSSQFAVQGASDGPPEITGSLTLERGHLTALPVLDRIAAFTSTERFRRLSLRKATLDFRQHAERLELTNIHIASEGLLRIEGYLTVDGGQLDGVLQVGLTPTTLARIPGAADRVFLPGRDGMHWSPVRISGTTLVPKEDLSDRLIAAGFEWMYEMVDGQLVLKESGRMAGDFAKNVWETAGEAGELGVNVLRQGAEVITGARLPVPVDPIREGVGGVLDSILGGGARTPTPREKEPQTSEQVGEERERKDPEKKSKEETNEAIEPREGRSIQDKFENLLEKELGVK